MFYYASEKKPEYWAYLQSNDDELVRVIWVVPKQKYGKVFTQYG